MIADTIWAGDNETLYDYLGEALASTPAQSLQDRDNAVINMRAVVAGRQFGKQNLSELFNELKGKQK